MDYWRPTGRYCLQTEAHVYALAVAASVLLSFYPFLIVMFSFCRHVLHSQAAADAIVLALNDYFPGELGDFIWRNLISDRHVYERVPVFSLLLLLFTANGVFVPLEVALNRIWGAEQNRSYWKNQLVALGLIFLCGGLALFSLMLTAMNSGWISKWAGSPAWINLLLFKMLAVPISMLALFFIYWLLPNRRIRAAHAASVAILVGLALEALKYVNLLVSPLLGEKIYREYNVFRHSVLILLWSFIAAMIVLAGAEWTARRHIAPDGEPAQLNV